ncbi:hypothetical protein [Anaeromyxobacter sp. PSR-1]|uniref:hypothetical protein n=1 Tax=Anaeromyxobacter sp. PSR-1 TaxID=1300915 RepID=UPI0005DE7657|nr:hypothetical protein [Anaeromyxobacter sp. PSR-1]GAO01312.1 hypothetical protein PSR1_00165 [Anaeromyxobacter sp. PSR-1]
MSLSPSPALQQIQAKLRSALQEEPDARKLEQLAAALIGRLLETPVFVASSGFQHGGDAGTAGRQQRGLRIEAKKYADSTNLDRRQLLGEMDHALARDECLEAWILVATRDVSEQIAEELYRKGRQTGVPVIIMGWDDHSIAPFAALCAWAPDLVESIYSAEAAALAHELVGVEPAVEQLRRDLQPWSLGFEGIRRSSIARLQKVWTSPRVSNEGFGQNVAGGAVGRKVPRAGVRAALDSWWAGPAASDAPAVVVGWEGVGKTWATVEWLLDREAEQPIVLLVPSSAVAGLASISESSLKAFLADRLGELTGVRDREHWRRRLESLLGRPIAEGPVLTVLFDGLNQESSVDWPQILKALQGEAFEGRVRIILTTRQLHFEQKLSRLRGLVVPAVEVRVDPFDATPGGELDQMLQLEGLSRADLQPDLIELARTPRLFGLVVRFRDKLVHAGQVTVHRLLWEYGRERAGVLAGRSFGEDEWRDWLRTIASDYRQRVRAWSLKTLGETVSRRDLFQGDVFARLSDIIDGQFMNRGPSGQFQLTPTVTAHALGTALLATLDSAVSADTEAELSAWLDPIAGLDERAEVLRAAVSILVQQGRSDAMIAGPLITAWLQTQNVPDHHRRELRALAPDIAGALLYVVEHSGATSQKSARTWAIQALRAIPRENASVLAPFVAELRRWFTRVSRDVDTRDPDWERRRAQRLVDRIGTDSSGPVTVLGVPIELVDQSEWTLTASAAPILEGFPLESAIPVFEAAAIELAIRGQCPAWDALKWLCLLNVKDPERTSRALVALSVHIRARKPESGVHPDLPARVAALVLWLTGREVDEDAAVALDPGIDPGIRYETDYVPDPAHSWLPLERRHAREVLLRSDLGLRHRILRTNEFWLDPTFEVPAQFVEEIRSWAASVDSTKLDSHGSQTIEDHNFEEFEPVLARCAPAALADLLTRKLRSNATCPEGSRYWRAIRGPRHFLLTGAEEAEAARALRLRSSERDSRDEWIVASELLILELAHESPFDQIAEIVEAGLADVLLDLTHIVGTPTEEDVDALLAKFAHGSERQFHDLLCLLASCRAVLSEGAWGWSVERARAGADVTRGHAFRLLAITDPTRFARTLLESNWAWSEAEHAFTNHYGSGALIEGAASIPFEQLAPRIAPWRLLEAARRRGGDPNEVRLAGTIVGRVLMDQRVAPPDLAVGISVDAAHRDWNPFAYYVDVPPPQDADPFRALKDFQDRDAHASAYRRAVEAASARIDDARAKGAHLYLADIAVDDMELLLRLGRDLVGEWLVGAAEGTSEFCRKVRLAEGAYLPVCEALLRVDPDRGEMLWRALRSTLVMRHIGAARVDELLHIIFRAPASGPVERLRQEVSELPFCGTDQALEDVAIAATINGATDWLEQRITSDAQSASALRRRRGVVFEGFRARNSLPVEGAWVEGELRTAHAQAARRAALNSAREASARIWWREYLTAPDAVSAYAAWALFLRAADRRAWIWMREEISRCSDTGTELFRRKLIHAQLNASTLRRAFEKSEEKRDSQFLMRNTVDTIGPWRTDRVA